MKKAILTSLAVVSLLSCNQTKNEAKPSTSKVMVTANLIELTTFKLNKGISSNDFLKSAEQMQKEFLKNQNGFIKRTLTVLGDTLWTDIVYWDNQESQSMAMKAAEKSELVMPFMEKIDFSTVKMDLTRAMLDSE